MKAGRSGWLGLAYGLVLLGLIAWSGWAHPQDLWGLGFAGALPAPQRVGLLLGACVLLVVASTPWFAAATARLGHAADSHRLLARTALALGALVLLALLHSRLPWYGAENAVKDLDRLYTTNMLSGLWLQLGAALLEPLAFAKPLVHERDPVVAIVSLASSVPFVLLLAGVARRLAPPPHRSLALALLLTTPCLALFAGHREIYFVPVLGLACFAWAALSDLERDRLPWRSGLAAGVALSAHLLNAALLPSLLLLLRGRKRGPAARLAALALPAAGWISGLLVYRWWFFWKGTIPARAFERWGSLAHLQPGENGLFWIIEPHQHAGFWDPGHLADVGNAVLFHAPTLGWVLLLAIPLLGSLRRRPRLAFLALLWLGSLSVLLVDRPFGGHLEQWSHNAGFGLSSALLLVGLWSERSPSPRTAGALLAVTAHQLLALLGLARLGLEP